MDEQIRDAARAAAERSDIPRPQLHAFYKGYEAAFADFMVARVRRKSMGALGETNAWDDVLRR